MSGRVQLRQGDMFDGPSDLIVIPCSTIPTVTPSVFDRLKHFRIDVPTAPMSLGEVVVRPFAGAENIASYVAYAASVRAGYGTEEESIEEIGRELGRISRREKGVQRIATPLLGSGAGMLSPEVVIRRLRDGFLAEGADRSTLNIFILDEHLYQRLVKGFRADREGEEPGQNASIDYPRIRVFVSYTRTTDAHAAWVKDLARYLIENGVDARLDVWDLRRGMDVAQWMCNELDLADRVILVCNEEYARKADRRHGGVGWEIRLVQGDLLSQEGNSDKYVAVIRSADPEKSIPAFLKSSYYLGWPPTADEGKKRTELLKDIYRIQEEKPRLGQPPAFVLQALSR
jgi:hypothetical protein